VELITDVTPPLLSLQFINAKLLAACTVTLLSLLLLLPFKHALISFFGYWIQNFYGCMSLTNLRWRIGGEQVLSLQIDFFFFVCKSFRKNGLFP